MGHSMPILPDQQRFGPTGLENYFIWIRERNRFVLTTGGERCLLYKRRFTGAVCPKWDKIRHQSQQHGQDNICQGTGFINKPLTINDATANIILTVSNIQDNTHISVLSTVGVNPGDSIRQGNFTTAVTSVTDATNLVIGDASGFTSSGYFESIEIVASFIIGGPETIEVGDFGRRHTFRPRPWTLWEPLLSESDFLVRRNNQRFWVQDVTVSRFKHYALHQSFSVAEVERNSPIYQIPSGL